MVLAVMALGIAYCRETNALLTVDFLVERLDPRVRARLVLAYGIASLAFCVVLDVYLARLVFQSFERNITAPTMTGTPLWIPQILLPVGITLLVLVVARKLIRPDPFGDAATDHGARE
jgi:TRAP-type C4-dicarboxylate transport system permease small subunit